MALNIVVSEATVEGTRTISINGQPTAYKMQLDEKGWWLVTYGEEFVDYFLHLHCIYYTIEIDYTIIRKMG
jgi:hypothetical protein